jgi:hypothetical protein
MFWIAALAIMALASFIARLLSDTAYPLAWGSLACLALLGLIRWFVARCRMKLGDVGLGWNRLTPRRIVFGLLVGAATYGATLAVDILLFGQIRFTAAPEVKAGPLLLALLGMVATITMEELVFRSFALWNSVHSVGLWLGQLLVALGFAGLHLIYGWPVMTVLLGVLPSAILFGAAAVVSRGLALPLGIHLGTVVARTLAGDTDRPLLLVMDTTALDPSAASLAPLIGATLPMLVAASLILLYLPHDRLRRSG